MTTMIPSARRPRPWRCGLWACRTSLLFLLLLMDQTRGIQGMKPIHPTQFVVSKKQVPRVVSNTWMRGGSIEIPDDNSGIILKKTRNVIRSLLEILNRKSPSLSNLFKSLVKTMEKITGVRLLPVSNNKKKKKKKRTKQVKEKKKEAVTETDNKRKKKKHSKEEQPKKKKSTTKPETKGPTASTQKHLNTNLSNKHANYRIQRELKEFLRSPPPNLSVKVGSNIRVWIITMVGATNTIYEGETYKLRVTFPKDYPTVPPSVYFLPPPPKHEHVYTNGDICLSLLGKGWRPTMTAQSIAVSILSILSSAQTKSIPMDNARHSQNKPGQYQKDWVYHDDNC